ncbi:hypothetical protein L1987_73778 [Smallanthus sonchifolius]|uniref:Uncharacterized protein n=1 Tax=Smallanthus sonchifolius TaxID=185202 RepID=A0ACB9A146_9ASTR|nr:hypothetical protein L1987_73778 [Smallanthus sonchifolius]
MEPESRNNKDVVGDPNEKIQPSSLSPPSPHEFNLDHYQQMLKQTPKMVIIFAAIALSCLVIYHSSITLPFSGGYMRPQTAGSHPANSDADIMWFRDPFSQFDKDDDIQFSCDFFNGNPFDLRNLPNTGFSYVKSNEKTIQFYKFWYNSSMTYPGIHDQDAFNRIKSDPFICNLGLRIRFIDTTYFGGFCQPSRDLNKVCTMHANCCVGLENKVHDIGIMLDDWRKYIKSVANQTTTEGYRGSWTIPQLCRGSFDHPRPPKKNVGQGKKS